MKDKINWRNTLFLTLTPLSALILIPIYFYFYDWSWWLLTFFVVGFVVSNMLVTCGYHRYFAHRTYDAHPIVEWLYVIFGAGSFQGSVVEWSADHRIHHREVDTEKDPYNIKRGFWYAHIGWLFIARPIENPEKHVPDLWKKPILRWQHNYYPWVATAVGFIFPLIAGYAIGIGWGGLLFGGILRIVFSQQSTFFINSLCHSLGNQPYGDHNSARDSVIMAVLTFGEGYHNYHHQFQSDYRNGVRWYQWDPTKWWIRSLSYVGLAQRLKQVSALEIQRAQISFQEKKLLAKGLAHDHVQNMRRQLEAAQNRVKQLRDDYETRKADARQQLKKELALAKAEFKLARRQWQLSCRRLATV